MLLMFRLPSDQRNQFRSRILNAPTGNGANKNTLVPFVVSCLAVRLDK